MSAPASILRVRPTLASSVFALLAPAQLDDDAAPEAQWLAAHSSRTTFRTLADALAEWWRSPPPEDQRLHRLAVAMRLGEAEVAAVALATAADCDVIAGRAIAWLQAPLRDAHPTMGLIACIQSQRGVPTATTIAALLDGVAIASGLLMLDRQGRTLPDASLHVPPPLISALAGGQGRWNGVRCADGRLPPPLAPSLLVEAARWAATTGTVLVVRSGHPLEAQAACTAIAEAAQKRAVFVEGEPPVGLGPWLTLHDAMPVLCAELAPGERRSPPSLPGFSGRMLVACGPEGAWEQAGESLPAWHVKVPRAHERAALWTAQEFDEATARHLAVSHRHACARIAQLAVVAHALSRKEGGAGKPGIDHVACAARTAGNGALGSLAELLPEDIPDEALILPEPLRRELDMLVARCRAREELALGLGPAARARYRPGVRALLVGGSGTGKTLACGWLATQLGMPLYRVDLAAVTSKYIGETEKNLGDLFARAEHAEVVLLFDEADALFGKRTEVKDSNDRFANQQTNYLLQRIEAYDGIALLTSNSRTRFDSAFTRRLDVILEFSAPGPEQRRDLWIAHLGEAHALSRADLNRVAAACDLSGGHIRNVTLAAKALAGTRAIALPMLLSALGSEYRKLGKQMPEGLASGTGNRAT